MWKLLNLITFNFCNFNFCNVNNEQNVIIMNKYEYFISNTEYDGENQDYYDNNINTNFSINKDIIYIRKFYMFGKSR